MARDDFSRIIVMGASSGGVTALLKIAGSLPAEFPAPILVVQHVGAQPSRLAELLSARGPNPAVEARDGERPAAGTIYVAPSDHHLLVIDGLLKITKGPKENYARPAIDPLFRTAALNYGPRLIGVILTGMLDDGSAGLRAVADCGGTTIVQDPSDALEPSMPRSALASTPVHHLSTVAQLPALLTALVSRPAEKPMPDIPRSLLHEQAASVGQDPLANLSAIGRPSTFSCPDCGGVMFEIDGGRPVRFRCHTGHAFSLLSLTQRQEDITDQALWTALRAMQEKEFGLRRLVEYDTQDPRRNLALRQEADALASAIEILRGLTLSTPDSHIND